MANVCIPNPTLDFIFTILIQVAIAFIFLTLFFFFYVSKVEQIELKNQVNIIIDNIFSDIQSYSNIISPLVSEDEKKTLKQNIINIIDKQQQEAQQEAQSSDQTITLNNGIIKSDSFRLLMAGVSILFFLILVVFIIGFCLPVSKDIFKAITILLIVATVEFSFLTFVAERYIVADVDQIKRSIADTVLKYIQTRK